MKITAITKYKHGTIYQLLEKLGWSQMELSRRSGLAIATVDKVINLKKRPSQEVAQKIQNAFGEVGEYMDILEEWPELFQGIKPGTKRVHTEDIEAISLEGCAEAMLVESEPFDYDMNAIRETLNLLIGELNGQQQEALKLRWLEGNATLEEAGNSMRVGKERVRQIELSAFSKLRRPDRIRMLEGFLE